MEKEIIFKDEDGKIIVLAHKDNVEWYNGAYVFKDGKIYEARKSTEKEVSVSDDWKMVTEFTEWIEYSVGDLIIIGEEFYSCTKDTEEGLIYTPSEWKLFAGYVLKTYITLERIDIGSDGRLIPKFIYVKSNELRNMEKYFSEPRIESFYEKGEIIHSRIGIFLAKEDIEKNTPFGSKDLEKIEVLDLERDYVKGNYIIGAGGGNIQICTGKIGRDAQWEHFAKILQELS